MLYKMEKQKITRTKQDPRMKWFQPDYAVTWLKVKCKPNSGKFTSILIVIIIKTNSFIFIHLLGFNEYDNYICDAFVELI